MPRIIGLSYGEYGTGKTAFWLGAPGPIAFFNFDEGLEGVVEDFQIHKDIFVVTHRWSAVNDDAQDTAIRIRDEFQEQYEQAIQNARTVVVDKGSQLWEIIRYAEFGAPNGQPRDYYLLNKFMNRMFSLAKATKANFGMIDGMKDEWGAKAKADGGKQLTKGGRKRRGWDEADEAAHVVLLHETDDDHNFLYTVKKSHGPGSQEIQYQSFAVANDPEEKLTAFQEFGLRLFPGSDVSDWT